MWLFANVQKTFYHFEIKFRNIISMINSLGIIQDLRLVRLDYQLNMLKFFNISNPSISLKLYFNKEGRMHLDLPPKTW